MSLALPPDNDRPDVITGEVVDYDTGRVGVAQHLPPHAAAALARVPGPAAFDPFERLVEDFLDEHPPNTARGYRTDLRQWVLWLIHEAVPEYRTHPLLATRPHVAAWRKHLEATPSPRTGRPLSAASVARKLSAVSELYSYAIELGVLDDNPVDNVKRPKVSDESQTVGLTTEELQRIFDAAEAHSPRLTAWSTSARTAGGGKTAEATFAALTEGERRRASLIADDAAAPAEPSLAPIIQFTYPRSYEFSDRCRSCSGTDHRGGLRPRSCHNRHSRRCNRLVAAVG